MCRLRACSGISNRKAALESFNVLVPPNFPKFAQGLLRGIANFGKGALALLRLWRATLNSRNGMIFAARSERAIREELIALVLAVPAAWLIGVTMMRRVELVCAVALVLVVELLNTAIEKLADRLTMDRDPQIGRVKDMGSAAVGVALLMAGLFWLFALAERMGAI